MMTDYLTGDWFDSLPDSLLLLIFNKIGDVKALGRCCAVSRRFHSLIPLVDNVRRSSRLRYL
ncbi:putative F-box domain-containing protein [Helianthus annuus]|nr:putative F-box protein AUF1 [Helianthus annuus]KAJ0455848.1 putative F-box domain-containing protein [Helianthus annuus]KAJ0473231.1 putative F-box protein AUF1 [Helianthus annuus]KAJ0652628.1 putative F-box protein AUF1 [Helianthus annuus]KAJ0844909.1 putative F-box domain-containing protein [Helianthus annuus]